MLIEGGSTDVHSALTENFNGQMAGAILGVVEEASLPAAAYSKLKKWVDAPTISIRQMRTDSFELDNFTKFVQTANSRDALPLEYGDQRCVVVRVPPLQEKIAWHERMEPALRQEASDFLGTLLAIKLPPGVGRLYLPVLMTPDKLAMMKVDHAAAVNALVPRIVELEWFIGKASQLVAELGEGPWPDDPSTISRYLDDARQLLRERGVVFDRPPRSNRSRLLSIVPTWVDDFCRRHFSRVTP
jgi:hypothetical protein